MATVEFKIGCFSCKNTDTITHMILWTEDMEHELYKNDKNDLGYIIGEEQNQEWAEKGKYISRQELVPLLEQFHDETDYHCKYCGKTNCFYFRDIKINDILITDETKDKEIPKEISEKMCKNIILSKGIIGYEFSNITWFEVEINSSNEKYRLINKRKTRNNSLLTIEGNVVTIIKDINDISVKKLINIRSLDNITFSPDGSIRRIYGFNLIFYGSQEIIIDFNSIPLFHNWLTKQKNIVISFMDPESKNYIVEQMVIEEPKFVGKVEFQFE